MSLLLGADIRVVSEDAKIGYSQPKIGIISIGGAMRLPEAIPGLARWYMFSGELIDAQEAYRLGLVVKIAKNGELLETATAMANQIIECSPMSVQYTKEEIAVAANVSMYEGLSPVPAHHEPLLPDRRLPRGQERVHGETKTRVEELLSR